jgi:seryl-tRNA synthetase
MLTVKLIEENKQEVLQLLAKKNFQAERLVDDIIETDKQRKRLQNYLDNHLAEINKISKEIGFLFKQGKTDEANHAREKTVSLKEEIKIFTQQLDETEKILYDQLVQLPNLPHESVPAGKTAEDNKEIRSGGIIPSLPENASPHWDLAKKYDIIDFEMGNKITGAGFPLYKGAGAKLQRALINFFLDEAQKAGYQEMMPPIMVNEDSGFGTGQLPDKEGQMYHVTEDNLYLIPTAEVPLTNIYRDVILSTKDFPVKITAYTPCFRREAGSYGKDVRGLNRLHQFDKVEIVQIQHPEQSYKTLEEMASYVESLLMKLELPYRIMLLCGGDMSFTSAKTYDFEVFAAGQQKWLEVSSVSNFASFQANRLKLRFKEEGDKKTQLAHTLNGSALALPRIVAAMMENYQSEKGIKIPAALLSYTGFEYIQ